MRTPRVSAPIGALVAALVCAPNAAPAMPPDDVISVAVPDAPSLRLQPAVDISVVVDAAWGSASRQDIQAVLSSVAAVMLENFPGKRLQPIVVAHSDLHPFTLFRNSPDDEYRVFLSAKDRYWARFVYEFAHELSHILSDYEHHKGAVEASANQWFEEALCEIGSLYALKSVAAAWERSPPYPNWAGYAKVLESYAERVQGEAHRELPTATSFAAWFKDAESQLENNPYMRQRNEVVANALLPLFEEKPAMWGAIGYLHQQGSPRNFRDYLRAWHERAPEEYKAAIGAITTLFGFRLDETSYAAPTNR